MDQESKLSDTPKSKKSVIVIGAGIAGLAAARRLSELGFTVEVLESQDEVGGRVRTNTSQGFCFEEGAAWIHGMDGNPIVDLAKEAGLTHKKTDFGNISVYDQSGKHHPEIFGEAFHSVKDYYFDLIDSIAEKGDDSKSFSQVFKESYPDLPDDWPKAYFLENYVNFDLGDEDKLSSVRYHEGEGFGEEEALITNGYNRIAAFLAKGLKIHLHTRVSGVKYAENRVIVNHSAGESQADYVVVTVPLGVLRSRSIKFVPELPEQKLVAIQKIGINCTNKFLVVFDRVFWDDTDYIVYTSKRKFKFNWFVNLDRVYPNSRALLAFAYADVARESESLSDEVLIEQIMTNLREVYGQNIPSPIKFMRTRWNSNPNAHGSYSSIFKETQMHHFEDIAQTVDSKLFFAGEHTCSKYYASVHGAFLSGLREATKIQKVEEDKLAQSEAARKKAQKKVLLGYGREKL